jgi:hypothetical protein
MIAYRISMQLGDCEYSCVMDNALLNPPSAALHGMMNRPTHSLNLVRGSATSLAMFLTARDARRCDFLSECVSARLFTRTVK